MCVFFLSEWFLIYSSTIEIISACAALADHSKICQLDLTTKNNAVKKEAFKSTFKDNLDSPVLGRYAILG